MKSTKSAVRYAKALLELAIEQNKLEAISNDMNAIIAANDETRDFQLFLSSPLIQAEKKVSIFNQLFDYFDELSLSNNIENTERDT